MLSQPYKTFRLLNLDIVLGALCGACFASKSFLVKPSTYFWITLAAAVWVTYTINHIMDGIHTQNMTGHKRYSFHYKNRITLFVVAYLVSITSAILVLLFFEKELLLFGIITSLLVAVYLALNNWLKIKSALFQKELIIAILYTWGIFGGFIFLAKGINLIQLLIGIT